VKEWMNYECSDEDIYTQNIDNSSTHSHPSEEENHNRSQVTSNICKFKHHRCDWIVLVENNEWVENMGFGYKGLH
jgi:hypothetical protein